jgi:hypothetical protein
VKKDCPVCGYPLDVSTGMCEPCGVVRGDEDDYQPPVEFARWVLASILDEHDHKAAERVILIQDPFYPGEPCTF